MARRPAPTFMVYEPDFRLTPSCLRQGHDKQEKALKLRVKTAFIFIVFLFFITGRLPLFHIIAIVMSLSWYDCPTFISFILSNTESSYYLWWTVRENVIIASIDKFNKICCVTGKIISSADCLLDCNKDRQLLNLMTILGRVNENHNFRWNLEQTPLQAEDPFQCKVHVYPFTMFSLWSAWFKQYVQQHKRTKHLAYSGFGMTFIIY